MLGARDAEEENGELLSGHRVLVFQDEKNSGDWLHNNGNVLNVMFKSGRIINFMLCTFYHN